MTRMLGLTTAAIFLLGLALPVARAEAPRTETASVEIAGGYWKTVRTRVWQPGYTERIWIEPVYDYRRDACGALIRIQIRPGYYETVHRPGCWVWRTERIWVETRGHGHGHGHGHDHGYDDHGRGRGRGRGGRW